MASKQGGSSRKIGRNFRVNGNTASSSRYMSRNHKMRSTRGNRYHRPAGECANCGSKQGPFRASWAGQGLRICRDLAICGKQRVALDWKRYPAVKVA
jgi:hypothetical protein